MRSPFIDQIHQTLPRLLALYDRDEAGASWGMGDRFYWAWGLIDFGNGTFQGAANGLTRLLVHGRLPQGFSESAVLRRIESMFVAADRLRRPDGSMEEAFPYEGSFCVTALVAYDLLTAVELLGERFTKAERKARLAVVRPMIAYLHRADETHAFISNHLATAVAALIKWNRLTGEDGVERGRTILDRILKRQSAEGWYCEYAGADPGYQTLCTYYLADVLRMTSDERLRESLARSVCFLWHFAHPDGSFGGLYGSRNTRFYYPAGIEYLASSLPEAAALAFVMRSSVASQRVVTLAAMDEPNLIPMFNAYCWAATLAQPIEEAPPLPCNSATPFRRYWPEAGLLTDRGSNHYTLIATCKGGVVYHYQNGHAPRIDPGLLFRDVAGRHYSTQHMAVRDHAVLEGDGLSVPSDICPVTRRLPKPWQFVVLRLLNLTLMRSMTIREWIKQVLVRLLITGNRRAFGTNLRRITLGENLHVEDISTAADGLQRLNAQAPFVAIHMASQGYWQMQDEA